MAKLMKNNPTGFNRYKKDENKTIVQPAIIDKEAVQQAYRDMMIAKREYNSKNGTYTYLHNKYLGLDEINKEFADMKDN